MFEASIRLTQHEHQRGPWVSMRAVSASRSATHSRSHNQGRYKKHEMKFKNIQEHSITFKNIQEHSRTFKNIQEHSRTFWGRILYFFENITADKKTASEVLTALTTFIFQLFFFFFPFLIKITGFKNLKNTQEHSVQIQEHSRVLE